MKLSLPKKGTLILLTALTMLIAASCVPEGGTHVLINPDFSEPDTIELNFTELHNDTLENFGSEGSSPYTFVSDVDISGSNTSRRIKADATVVEGAEEEDAKHFAAALILHIGEAATNQYPTLDPGNSDVFGEIYDTYEIDVSVTDTEGDEIYSLKVPAGDDIPLDPDIEPYEEEWREFYELYMQGLIDDEEASMMGEEDSDSSDS